MTHNYDEDDVIEGEQIGVSEITGTIYRTTQWVEKDDHIVALEKEPLTVDQIRDLSEQDQEWIEEQLGGIEEL